MRAGTARSAERGRGAGRRGTAWLLGAALLLGTSLVGSGCAPPLRPAAEAPAGPFPFAEYDALLKRYTDGEGRVDYAALKRRDAAALERLYASIAATGPDGTPALYRGRGAALAYYLSAYNLLIWKNVIEQLDRDPPLSRLDAGLYRFFRSPEFIVDGQAFDLYDLEHKVIRKRFRDGRIHFALNCASAGCPLLPAEAFVPERVDQQLEREARRFVTEPRNVRLDEAGRTVTLSKLFRWYAGDFDPAGDEQAVLRFINRLREAAGAAALPLDVKVRYADYDWRLNEPSLVR